MKAIVAADLDWGIGYEGKLLERIPDDMKLFKQLTFDHVIVMGRKTLESLPGGKPLEGRTNIVLSRDEKFTLGNEPGVILRRSVDDVLESLKKVHYTRDVFIIGGAEIYKEFLQYCDIIYVTKSQKRYTADRFFKNLDIGREFRLLTASDPYTHNGVGYNFLKYERLVEKKKIP